MATHGGTVVANAGGGPTTSSREATRAAIPASESSRDPVRRPSHPGVTTVAGHVTNPAVAASLGLPFVEPARALL